MPLCRDSSSFDSAFLSGCSTFVRASGAALDDANTGWRSGPGNSRAPTRHATAGDLGDGGVTTDSAKTLFSAPDVFSFRFRRSATRLDVFATLSADSNGGNAAASALASSSTDSNIEPPSRTTTSSSAFLFPSSLTSRAASLISAPPNLLVTASLKGEGDVPGTLMGDGVASDELTRTCGASKSVVIPSPSVVGAGALDGTGKSASFAAACAAAAAVAATRSVR